MPNPGFLRPLLAALVLAALPFAQAEAACSSPSAPEGNIMYNQASHVYQYCSGTVWKAFAKAGASPGGAGCSNPTATEGKLIYNSDYKTLQFCDGTNWVATASSSGTGGGSCPAAIKVSATDGALDFAGSIWGDGTYIYASNDNRKIKAYTFNGTAFTELAQSATATGVINQIWGGPDTNGNGSYVYAAAAGSGIEAWAYNGGTNTWAARIQYDTLGSSKGVWGDGSYIYVADGGQGVEAFTFDGTTWTLAGAYDTGTANRVWGDGTYIYVADTASGLHALTWNGTAWTSVATMPTYEADDVSGDGTYIYTGGGYDGLHAFTFNGTSFTEVGAYTNLSWADNVYVKDGYIYVTTATSVDVLTFDGTDFTPVAYLFQTGSSALAIWNDNNYTYLLDGFDGLIAYPKCN